MVLRVVIAAALVLVALVVAWVLERRRREPPARGGTPVPGQLDRADFPRPDAPYLVVLFSSATCQSCEDVAAKVEALASDEVAVFDAEYGARRDLHERYGIEAVPLVVVADAEGVTRRSFLGATTATDLWAAVAELRRAGSTPERSPGRGPASPGTRGGS